MNKNESIDGLEMLSNVIQSINMGHESLPKTCLLSAEDIAGATSAAEIDFFSNFDTADSILTTLLEHENRLKRAFESTGSTSIHRPCSRANLNEFLSQNTLPQVSYQLPQVEEVEPLQISCITPLNFSEFIGFNGNSKPNQIGQFLLVHPLAHPFEFNNAINEIALVAHAVQTSFQIRPEIMLIPVPGFPQMQFGKKERKRLWFNSKIDPQTEINDLQQTLVKFTQLLFIIAKDSCEALHIECPIKSADEINISVALVSPPQPNVWNPYALKLCDLARFFAEEVSIKANPKSIINSTSEGFFFEEINATTAQE